MEILVPAVAREHLRVGDEVSDEELGPLISAAEAAVADFLGRPLIDAELGWATVDEVPANVVHAIKLVLGDLNAVRETSPDLSAQRLRALIGRYVVIGIG